ncbi:putative Zn-ribbon RNA-binding protein [Halovivax ruber XH-70]|uniref:Ribosome biogenesis protein Nop10 n=1 Tax=Halovivax ruber (strain DSM 18193 / JCM 13892 / XH-70) TaxID=797302 RepID=L0IBR9_HALRX|nr:RNA-protein complex protein Nop10 [Halovivax ruber]AGB15686.1 putative Zn-ribbon RNA-binding protein [Halovivax ruber XH-70]
MKSDIRICHRSTHDRPVYSLTETCPSCGADTVNSAPAPFSPDDPSGKYRRALKRRHRS